MACTRSPFGRYGAFSVSALSGLVTMTFDLSIYKWCHGHTSCQLTACYILPFSTYTDNNHQHFMPHPMGTGERGIRIFSTSTHCFTARD